MAESWALKGEIAGACPCDSPCPCIFGRDPDKGVCTAIFCMSIASGNYGSTDLSGRKVSLAFSWTGNVFSGDIMFGAYVDDGADDEQVSAFDQILTGKAGGAFEQLAGLYGTVKGIKRVPIEFRDGKKPTFKIGTLANAELELLVGADQKGPLLVQNSPFDFGGEGLKIGTSTGRFVDKEWGFDTELNYGDHGTVDLSA
jgi:hypothetical protein